MSKADRQSWGTEATRANDKSASDVTETHGYLRWCYYTIVMYHVYSEISRFLVSIN